MERGALLVIAIILTMVFLSVAIAISGFTLSDIQLSQSASQSNYALYAADTGLECALYYDLKHNVFFDMISEGEATQQIADGCGESDEIRIVTPFNPNTECGLPAGYDGCFTFTTPVDVGLEDRRFEANVMYMYDTGGREVTIVSRGYNQAAATDRRVERALQYTYSF